VLDAEIGSVNPMTAPDGTAGLNANLTGEVLGHYHVLEKLGEGGMGVAYKARDTRLDRLVAIKVLPPDKMADSERRRRFVHEAKAASSLNHAHIITIYEIDQANGLDFIAMEYVSGKTLDQLISRKRLPVGEVLDYAVQIAEALDAAHAAGIVHRDLKPGNIMITKSGSVKVLDFGLAKLTQKTLDRDDIPATITSLTEEGIILGTVSYMSPEQALGKEVDAQTDIFSFGVVLYEAATGKLPFPGITFAAQLDALLHRAPISPIRLSPELPGELERIIYKTLEKDCQARYQSARDLLIDLRRLKRDTDSGGSTARAPVSASLHRRLTMPGLTVLALVFAIAVCLYLLVGRTRAIDSLAVLPFVNVGADPNAEYLSDGITENLINSLSQLPKLRVVPRSRVFRYKGRATDPEEIGQELRVRAVLTGRVVQRGDSLNIQTELVDVAADSQLWGRQFDRKFSEIIPLQEEIARAVSEKLRLRPTSEEEKRLTKRYTENPQAHQLYLKGRYLWNRRTGQTLSQAAEYFEQAIEKDARYALAWAGLADCYTVYNHYQVLPPREAAPKAREAANKALALDSALAEPHAALGHLKTSFEWDWEGAEREFKRAIELDPNLATAHSWYSLHLAATGRLDRAIAESERAQEADPLSPIVSSVAGWTFYFSRRYDQAIEQLRKTLEIDKNFALAHWFLGMTYQQVARHEEAIAEFQRALSLFGGPQPTLGWLGHAYAVSGKRTAAQKVLAELKELSKRRYVDPSDIAEIYIGLGDKAHALEWLERAYEDRGYSLTYIKVEPAFDRLRGEPRFQQLLRGMNLAP
jgi:eukaryotic-like serine/threonine-protein kinase